MKSARKLLIFNLAFLLILSSVNTTAFAEEIDKNTSNTAVIDTPVTMIENASFDAIETAQSLNPAVQNNNVSDSSVVSISTADNKLSRSETTTALPVNSPDQTSDTITDTDIDIEAPVESNPGIILTVGQEIAVLAMKYDGFKYVYGAASPSVGFDCSGFAYYIYNQFGYQLPRTAHLQYRNGTSVEKSELQAGDLVFFATNGGRAVSHVGFYIGNNQFIHAATTQNGVMVSSLDNSYWTKAWVGAKRMVSSDYSVALNNV